MDDLQVQKRGDIKESFNREELYGKVRGTGLSAGQVNKVVQRVEQWAETSSVDNTIDHRDLNRKIEEGISEEDPSAGAKFAMQHGDDD